MALSEQELKQAKREILQELISSMHKMMADKFAPEAELPPMEGPGLELSAEQASLETPEGKEEFGPEISISELPEPDESAEEQEMEAPEHEAEESPEEEQAEEEESEEEEEEAPSSLDSFLSKIPPHKMPKEEDEDEEEEA